MPRPIPTSAYYPPRARWYSRLLAGLGTVRRRLALDRIRMPVGISLRHFFGGLLVPGLAVYLRGPRLWGKAAFIACGVLAAIFVVFMGFPLGNIAFGLLIGVHVTGFLYLTQPVMGDARFPFRIGFSIVTLIMISCLLYFPARDYAQRHWFMPLRTADQVVIVHRTASLKRLKRGDWIAYSLDELRAPGVYVQKGFGFGPILAGAGDRVVFYPRKFEVNGLAQPSLPNMPGDGSLVIERSCWFVWPELARKNYVRASGSAVTSALMSLSQIKQEQIVGVPFKRWFWRRQM